VSTALEKGRYTSSMEEQPEAPTPNLTTKNDFTSKAAIYHERIPGIRKLPFSVVAIILLILSINIIVWAVVGVVLVGYSQVHLPCWLVTNILAVF
jgi:hypothetical protein